MRTRMWGLLACVAALGLACAADFDEAPVDDGDDGGPGAPAGDDDDGVLVEDDIVEDVPDDGDPNDMDGDGAAAADDCDDYDPALNLDDADGDGWTTCAGDCDDANADAFPGADEILCDGIDSACDGGRGWDVPEDAETIQAAIELAFDGDEICVAAGTYAERIDTMGKALAVVGVAGASETTLDGGAAGSVITIASGETPETWIQGFTVINGVASDGGGVHVANASPVLKDVKVADNEADAGGGVYLANSGALLVDVVIRGNLADDAGGLMIRGGAPSLAFVTVEANLALADGGGIYVDDGSPRFDNVVVIANVAEDDGAGLYASSSAVAMTHGLLSANRAVADGGGMMLVEGSRGEFENVIVSGNVAERDGGGMHMMDGSAPALRHVAVVGNHAADDGGGLAVTGGSAPAFSDAILVRNSAADDGGGMLVSPSCGPSFSHSDVWGNAPDNIHGADHPVGQDGNVATDPGFRGMEGGDALSWDLHLTADSALVDAGTATAVDPDGSPADIGPYGGPRASGWDLDHDGDHAWWQPGPYDAQSYPAMGLDCADHDPMVDADGC